MIIAIADALLTIKTTDGDRVVERNLEWIADFDDYYSRSVAYSTSDRAKDIQTTVMDVTRNSLLQKWMNKKVASYVEAKLFGVADFWSLMAIQIPIFAKGINDVETTKHFKNLEDSGDMKGASSPSMFDPTVTCFKDGVIDQSFLRTKDSMISRAYISALTIFLDNGTKSIRYPATRLPTKTLLPLVSAFASAIDSDNALSLSTAMGLLLVKENGNIPRSSIIACTDIVMTNFYSMMREIIDTKCRDKILALTKNNMCLPIEVVFGLTAIWVSKKKYEDYAGKISSWLKGGKFSKSVLKNSLSLLFTSFPHPTHDGVMIYNVGEKKLCMNKDSDLPESMPIYYDDGSLTIGIIGGNKPTSDLLPKADCFAATHMDETHIMCLESLDATFSEIVSKIPTEAIIAVAKTISMIANKYKGSSVMMSKFKKLDPVAATTSLNAINTALSGGLVNKWHNGLASYVSMLTAAKVEV